MLAFLLASEQAYAQGCDEPFARPSYPTRQAFCTLGQLLPDAYEKGRLVRCEEMEVDHLISLRQAWASGVCGKDLRRLANDPRNLRFTYWRTNRQKGYLSPEDFAARLPSDVASGILRDANALMRDYGIKSREEATLNRMLTLAEKGKGYTQVLLSQLSKPLLERLTFREIRGRTVAFIGKKAVGVAVGAGVAIEGINAANWAVGWITTPQQSKRMAARADMLREIFVEQQ